MKHVNNNLILNQKHKALAVITKVGLYVSCINNFKKSSEEFFSSLDFYRLLTIVDFLQSSF